MQNTGNWHWTMALESMTLLQNKNNVLPLKKSAKKIAVVGPNADNEPMLWGNYNGKPHKNNFYS